MRATTIKPGVLLLDDGAARYVRGKGYEPVEGKDWKRYPWASFKLDLRKDHKDHKTRGKLLADLIRQFDTP